MSDVILPRPIEQIIDECRAEFLIGECKLVYEELATLTPRSIEARPQTFAGRIAGWKRRLHLAWRALRGDDLTDSGDWY